MMQTECEVYAATPVSSHGRLSVKGADLVDKNKKKFQLRGISTHGINWDEMCIRDRHMRQKDWAMMR